jgi:hypothetical protein
MHAPAANFGAQTVWTNSYDAKKVYRITPH